jgi:hypothetical protein
MPVPTKALAEGLHDICDSNEELRSVVTTRSKGAKIRLDGWRLWQSDSQLLGPFASFVRADRSYRSRH